MIELRIETQILVPVAFPMGSWMKYHIISFSELASSFPIYNLKWLEQVTFKILKGSRVYFFQNAIFIYSICLFKDSSEPN